MIKNRKLFEIAKIIDSEYTGNYDNFMVTRKSGYYYLTTGRCDYCLPIKVYSRDCVKIDKIQRLSLEVDGWIDLHPDTISRIAKYLRGRRLSENGKNDAGGG